ncbi:hydroxyphenylacetyl-CoA thioesterase PaaI [Thauera sinica]|uniref:Hydroxyphenylacetyl-CoA thioesterase PaaI n=1 Tax=Thauera sinica TaxID=2665146 RepID=A0ABW1AXU3_9RHOO|nr:hydroxyphenylacetyl-CoA thioesterase PaaI [Thauera sp. K11]ATE61230.1 phenylacetic acid degradation protein PaaD [Thauera sp. K11]
MKNDETAAAADAVAQEVGAEMYRRDRVAQRLGMKIEEVRPGFARIAMTVIEDMINGHGICHGGYTFALADTACAYACNSYNVNTLSQAVNIVFMAPARLGETLAAEAVESSHAGRTGSYDIKVYGDGRRVVAVALGQCRSLRGRLVESLPSLRDSA